MGYTHRWNDNHSLETQWSASTTGAVRRGTPIRAKDRNLGQNNSTTEQYREQSMPINVNSWEAKVDYTNKLNDWLKLEARYNGNFTAT